MRSNLQIKELGTSDLIEAIAWTCYRVDKDDYYVWRSFMIGIDEWENNLKECVEELTTRAKTLLDDKDIQCEFDFDEQKVRLVSKRYLSQVFSNQKLYFC